MNGFPQALSVSDTIKSNDEMRRAVLASALPSVRKAVWSWMERSGLPTTIDLDDTCNMLSRRAVEIMAAIMSNELNEAGYACRVMNHTHLALDRAATQK